MSKHVKRLREHKPQTWVDRIKAEMAADKLLAANALPAKAKKPEKRSKRRKNRGAKRCDPRFAIGQRHPEYNREAEDKFLRSTEWRQLRYLALRNCGGACQCCGAKGNAGAILHVDHIIPRYKRPDLKLSLDNLQVLCEDCNIGKGAWDDTDFRPPCNR